MALVYRSKIDIWVLIILLFVIGASTAGCIVAVRSGGWTMWLTLVLTGGFGIVVPIWALFATRYTLEPNDLEIQSGPFRWKVPISEITSITPTSNPLSSPALSLDRLRIEYAEVKVMISPENQDDFLSKIESLRNAARSKR